MISYVLVIRYFIYIFSFHPFNRRFCSAADSRLTKSVKDCYNAPVVQGRIYGRLEAFFERIQANPCGLPFTRTASTPGAFHLTLRVRWSDRRSLALPRRTQRVLVGRRYMDFAASRSTRELIGCHMKY
ncbi:protein of unknown function [Methanoculleus bourgensis]|uniref:Uncharacterized protein n=1 Tax=Methanoculleus bourgensis TaxID=83986 RepID=A0A0X3BNM5_9EURY|nr:protein of unknown function [Methanoculleus bourgensis]